MRRPAVAAALLLALALPATASAHARLLSATPADGAVVPTPPRTVVLRFDETVSRGPGVAAVDANRRSVLGAPVRANGRTLTIPLRPVGRGSYSIRWSVISDDGHTVTGVLAFAIGVGSRPQELLSAANDPPAVDVIARWLLLTGALIAGGAAAFLLAVGRIRRVTVLAGAGFVAAAAGAGVEWARVPTSTRYGEAMIVAFVAALAGAAGSLAGSSRTLVLPAAVLVAAPPAGGHALDPGVPRIQVVVDAVHLAAASVWVGGLAALALTLPRGGSAAARRFSRIALIAVAVIALTGVLRAVSELSAVGQVFSTGYGRALLVKTVLFAALIGLGYYARAALLGRPRLLRRSVTLELALLGGVTVAVAILTSIAPGRNVAAATVAPAPAGGPAPAPPTGAVTAAKPLGSRAVAVAAQPSGGKLRVTVTVIGPGGDGVGGLDVRTNGSSTSSCGTGCYAAVLDATRALHVQVGGGTVDFALPKLPLQGGQAVLRQIGERYLRSRTARFSERLSSGPGQVVTSTWELASPASLSFRASDGSSGIVIGGRRWDRQGRGRWVESQQSPHVPQPQLPWPSFPRDVVLLPPATVDGRRLVRVSFVDPSTPAWYLVSADAGTKELRRIDMVAPAHFMRDDYHGLDVPVRIRPPVTSR